MMMKRIQCSLVRNDILMAPIIFKYKQNEMKTMTSCIFRKSLILMAILASSFLFASAQETITGLHYFDQSPVSIEIKEGKITQVTRLDKLPEGTPEVFIAPGFFDNQVNG